LGGTNARGSMVDHNIGGLSLAKEKVYEAATEDTSRKGL